MTIKVEKLPTKRDLFAEYLYRVHVGKAELIFGFRRYNFLNPRWYMWVSGAGALKFSDLRKLRVYAQQVLDLPLECEVSLQDKKALHFATFFGFRSIGVVGDRIKLERG